MKESRPMTILVTIKEFEDKMLIAKKGKKTGKPRYWTVNGQSLYNAALHFTARAKVTTYFHDYLLRHVVDQIAPSQIIDLNEYIEQHPTEKLSVSLDIYEVRRGKMPDIGNLWIWIKWFEDVLQECEIIPNDNPNYIIESGRTKYHWVNDPQDRKLQFKIEFIKQ